MGKQADKKNIHTPTYIFTTPPSVFSDHMSSANQYNFILDASAFEKGLGNIKRWAVNCPKKVKLRFYIPTYTLRELDFLQHRRKSFNAREALKFIDDLSSKPAGFDPIRTNSGNGAATVMNTTASPPEETNTHIELFVEFPEILSTIPWSQVNVDNIDYVNKAPRRLRDLLKSCTFKCSPEENDDGLHWILITEDPQIQSLVGYCNIPWCSIVDADSILSKDLNDRSFRASERFNKLILKNGVKEQNVFGQDCVKTDFSKDVYASRGKGKLWSPT